MTEVIIWHNPRCSKSRQALAALQDRGIETVIRKYLDDAPTLAELSTAQAALGVPAIDMVRVKEARFKELGLSKDADDETLLQAMADNPVLIERPVVFTNGKAAIGRPTDAIFDIL